MKPWKSVWLSRVVVFALTLSVFSACDDAAGPEDVDPVQTSSTVDSAVSQYITTNPALQNLDVLGQAMGAALNAPNAVLLKPQSGFGSFRQLGTDIGEAVRDAQLRRGSSGASLMAIPVGLLGKTLVYNVNNGKYEIDPARTDAPANGVRFAMYAVDPLLGQPVEPLNEIGYFDIIDTSDFPTVSVSLIAVVGTETLLSYSVTGTFSETASSSINVTGFISDGINQLDFTIALTGDDTSGSITIDLSFADATVHIQLSDTVDGGDSGRIVITQGGNSVVFEVSEDAQGNVTGTISFNGTVVAQMSGTFEAQVFTNAEGGDLTAAEIEGIGDMFDAIGEMFVTVENLIDLAFVLLGLGLI